MRYEELRQALDVLGLPLRATLQEIRQRHHDLVRLHHPDRTGCENDDIRRINEAYALISTYLDRYVFSFSEDDFLRQCPEERLRRQFAHVWGDQ